MARRPVGRRPSTVLAAAVLVAIAAGPAMAVDNSTVRRFVALSDQFHAQVPNSRAAGLNAAQKRTRAVCILTRFETAFGPVGVQALMRLMNVLSKGTEFDDPTVISFNERYGAEYERTVSRCTQEARTS